VYVLVLVLWSASRTSRWRRRPIPHLERGTLDGASSPIAVHDVVADLHVVQALGDDSSATPPARRTPARDDSRASADLARRCTAINAVDVGRVVGPSPARTPLDGVDTRARSSQIVGLRCCMASTLSWPGSAFGRESGVNAPAADEACVVTPASFVVLGPACRRRITRREIYAGVHCDAGPRGGPELETVSAGRTPRVRRLCASQALVSGPCHRRGPEHGYGRRRIGHPCTHLRVEPQTASAAGPTRPVRARARSPAVVDRLPTLIGASRHDIPT